MKQAPTETRMPDGRSVADSRGFPQPGCGLSPMTQALPAARLRP